MKKIIICDQNKELIDFLKDNLKEGEQPSGVFLEFVHGDVIELHEKTKNSRIVTASNPQFDAGGGLDYVLSQKYSWSEAKEFTWNDDLFFAVSVDSARNSSLEIVKRALVGVLGYVHKFVPILTGIGTAIGGLPVQDLLDGLTTVLSSADLSSADLSSANLRYANLSSANLRYANLSSADLRSANLSSADLRSANLGYANLSYADLRSANLSSADLRSANLRYANLSSADLGSADLGSADLSSANLRYADLGSADLSSADLRSADLRYANLRYADLSSADLRSANLRYANLSSANLNSAKNIDTVYYNAQTAHFALGCPEEGDFIGWKQCVNGSIVKLLIPANAKRSSATTRKCRASQAKVLAIFDKKGKEIKETISTYDKTFIYKVGKIVKPTEKFEKNRWVECGAGIHFFITRREAELYNS